MPERQSVARRATAATAGPGSAPLESVSQELLVAPAAMAARWAMAVMVAPAVRVAHQGALVVPAAPVAEVAPWQATAVTVAAAVGVAWPRVPPVAVRAGPVVKAGMRVWPATAVTGVPVVGAPRGWPGPMAVAQAVQAQPVPMAESAATAALEAGAVR